MVIDSILSRPNVGIQQSKSDFSNIKIQTKNLNSLAKPTESNISEEDLKMAIKKFFDDLEKNGDK